ncbi:MAG: hypothetical protein CMO80_15455 [Verrucomicrobiales bacterium]|nr:hypothetical protein [Verrucomicrobiales bacterium]|tara:strand:+ start:611 stop:2500 length:1890 start_codon:yes stop_codon:yes gene_type:complete
MIVLRNPLSLLVLLILGLGFSWHCEAQNTFAKQAGEYYISGQMGADQVLPDVSINGQGGIIVWQDNSVDGAGTGICAQRLNANLSGENNAFQVNSIDAGNQGKPQVRMLPDGGAVFAWEGGEPGQQNIYVRYMDAAGTFAGPDIQVNQYNTDFQIRPKLAVASDGKVMVVWSSSGQDGHFRSVFGRVIAADKSFAGNEFQINVTTHLNQRTPDVAALDDGRFAVVWITEKYLGLNNTGGGQYAIDVLGRLLDDTGAPVTGEISIENSQHLCANPSVSSSQRGFVVVWGQRNVASRGGGWDVYGAGFDLSGTRLADPSRLNTYTFGDQYAPKLARSGANLLAVWSSMGQDSSYEGVFGSVLTDNGAAFGEELAINSETRSRQQHPDIEGDDTGRFLVTWSGYTIGTGDQMDIKGQRLANAAPLPVLPAPYLSALSQTRISVSWAPLAGFTVQHYEVYVDDAAVPLTTTDSHLSVTGLVPGSSHSIKLGYRLNDGRQGAFSLPSTLSTWGEDLNFDGLPDDWQARYWTGSASSYPAVFLDSDGDGASNVDEFLAGTDPTDSDSVLKLYISRNGNSLWLNWNSMPGNLYQVQRSADMRNWQDVGNARFAVDATDTLLIGNQAAAIYRIIRVR